MAADAIDVEFTIPATHRLRFTDDLFGTDADVLSRLLEPSGDRPARVQFWVDGYVAQAQPKLIDRIEAFMAAEEAAERAFSVGRVQITPGGEDVKNDVHLLEDMLKSFNAANLDRRSYVVVVGGGAVLDAVGFAVAVAHRGLRLIRIPTTTLAQADSGVGVKNSINLFQKKNWAGTFAVPWAVINDAAMLASLSDRDYVCGFSEAVKVFSLKDASLFDELCRLAPAIRRREPAASQWAIRASAKLHLDHITRRGDPFEANEARPLDFGHWSAHKLETLSHFELRHGEAVGIGVAIDMVYSSLVHGLPRSDARRGLQCLADLGLPLDHALLRDPELLFVGMEEFRQHLGGRLTLTMLTGLGRAIDVHEVDVPTMRAAIDETICFARVQDGAESRAS